MNKLLTIFGIVCLLFGPTMVSAKDIPYVRIWEKATTTDRGWSKFHRTASEGDKPGIVEGSGVVTFDYIKDQFVHYAVEDGTLRPDVSQEDKDTLFQLAMRRSGVVTYDGEIPTDISFADFKATKWWLPVNLTKAMLERSRSAMIMLKTAEFQSETISERSLKEAFPSGYLLTHETLLDDLEKKFGDMSQVTETVKIFRERVAVIKERQLTRKMIAESDAKISENMMSLRTTLLGLIAQVNAKVDKLEEKVVSLADANVVQDGKISNLEKKDEALLGSLSDVVDVSKKLGNTQNVLVDSFTSFKQASENYPSQLKTLKDEQVDLRSELRWGFVLLASFGLLIFPLAIIAFRRSGPSTPNLVAPSDGREVNAQSERENEDEFRRHEAHTMMGDKASGFSTSATAHRTPVASKVRDQAEADLITKESAKLESKEHHSLDVPAGAGKSRPAKRPSVPTKSLGGAYINGNSDEIEAEVSDEKEPSSTDLENHSNVTPMPSFREEKGDGQEYFDIPGFLRKED